MKYFLIFVGLIGVGFGIFFMAYGPPDGHAHASAIMISGAIFFAAGAATVDIVDAIRNKRE